MNLKTLFGAALLALSSGASAALQVGQPAPAFTGVDTTGQTHSLSDFLGKVVVLEWTNHDCPYVRKHYDAGNMQTQQREATADGVVWLSIISSAPGKQGHVSPAEADELTTSRDAAPTAVLLDESGDIGRAYKARTTPHMYVIDAEGRLAYMGGIDNIPSANPADIDEATQFVPAALAQVMAGKAADPSVTRPYGCSVKY
ncbi:MAG: thioredoxin family protein [Chromatiaceae bacterium]|jgi:peroxiredoxin